jgi:hypothetical protein
MKLRSGLVLSSLLSLGLLTYACANGDTVSGSTGNGGSGQNNTGGSSSNNNTGGSSSNNNTGGSSNNNSGGSQGAGGVHGSGGATGSTSSGAGGTTTPGNTGGSTGTTGTGGSSAASCGTSFSVGGTGFVTMPAVGGGCWSGYGFVYADKFGSTFMPADFTMCGTPCKLGITGTIAAVSGTSYTYEGLGFSLGDPQTGGGTTHPDITPRGSGLTIAFTNTTPATLPLRAQLLDSTGTTWCYTITGASPVTIPYSSFTQECYNTPPGLAYAKNPIDRIELQVAGGTAMGAVDLTITSVTENP